MWFRVVILESVTRAKDSIRSQSYENIVILVRSWRNFGFKAHFSLLSFKVLKGFFLEFRLCRSKMFQRDWSRGSVEIKTSLTKFLRLSIFCWPQESLKISVYCCYTQSWPIISFNTFWFDIDIVFGSDVFCAFLR